MVLKTNELRDAATKMFQAIDSSDNSQTSDTLQIVSAGGKFYLKIRGTDYYAYATINTDSDEEFSASVDAKLFLKVVSLLTTDTLEMFIDDKSESLVTKGNGTYKFPLIFNGDTLLELPVIDIANVTTQFPISTSVIQSVVNYNTKELAKLTASSRPVQQMYYIDDKGAITFTSGACVNNFTLDKPVKILLSQKIVKLLKLFRGDTVNFTVGHDAISEEITQTKVRFEDGNVSVTAILPIEVDSMVQTVPVEAIRNRAFNNYPYSVVLNRDAFIGLINRLMLFAQSSNAKPYGMLEFGKDSVTIYDNAKVNFESINYDSESNIEDTYVASVDLNDFRLTLEGCPDNHITLNFGDNQAFVIAKGDVFNVVPEVKQF